MTDKIAYSIHHTNFPIRDAAATEEWYSKVFGMTKIEPTRPTTVAGVLLLTNGNFDLHFHVVEPEQVDVGMTHTAVEVSDWDSFIAHLDEIGERYLDARDRGHNKSRTGSLVDPDGHRVEFTHHAERSW